MTTSKSPLPPLSPGIASYQNQLLYVSVYVAVSSYFLSSAISESASLLRTSCCWLAVAVTVLAIYWEVSFMILRRTLPPGDSGFPIFGHFPAFLKTGDFMVGRIKRYGSMSTCSILGIPGTILTEDEDVNWILTMERKGKTTKRPPLRHLRELIGDEAIFFKTGAHHKRLRKIFEPAFTPLAIRDSVSTIDAIAQQTLQKWCDSGNWNTPRDWALLAMRIFMTCAFGEADSERMDRLTNLFENWMTGFTTIIPLNLPGTALYKAHTHKEQLGQVMVEMISEFRAKNPPNSQAAQSTVMGRLCYATDDEGNPPTQQQLLDNLRFFLVAGFDTTKGSFGAISRFLKQNPHAEAALVQEVKSLKEPLDIDQLKNGAPILNAILAESWRLTAPLGFHAVVALEDLHCKGYKIPKDSYVFADIEGHAQLNNKRHPKAAEFHFERWLPKDHPLYDPSVGNTEDVDFNRMDAKFRTFSMGPHMCLGGHFAKLEVRIVVTRLFQKYRVETRNECIRKIPTKQTLSDFKLTGREEGVKD